MSVARRAAVAIAILSILAVQVGCTAGASGEAVSRHALYASIDELAADSTAIVIGTVVSQHPSDRTTVSMVEVANTPASPELAANVPASPTVRIGDTVGVRQDPASRPLLEVGAQYVLWLTPSVLPGDAAAEFFITGSIAGAYRLDGRVASRVATDTGDDLPDTIEVSGDPA